MHVATHYITGIEFFYFRIAACIWTSGCNMTRWQKYSEPGLTPVMVVRVNHVQ